MLFPGSIYPYLLQPFHLYPFHFSPVLHSKPLLHVGAKQGLAGGEGKVVYCAGP